MKGFCRICFIYMVLCLFLALPVNIDAQLQERDYNLIRVAFMNGCIRTFNELQNETKLHALKKDEATLRIFVESQAAEYMKELNELNRR